MKDQNKRLVILLHEIYGVNQHMQFIQKMLEDEGYNVVCPNLINRDSYDYANEKEAYLNYINNVSFENSLKIINSLIEGNRNAYNEIYVIGFSVGATTAWLCSKLDVQGVVCFYGSRIRDYVDVEPNCPTLLLFAQQEVSFSPEQLINKLRLKQKVEAYILDGEHGFADPFSKRYNDQLFNQAKKLTLNFLRTSMQQV